MTKSMTGYGYGRFSDETLTVEVEAKSINHRYADISIRLPKELNYLENGVRKLIKKRFFRGRFDVWAKVEWPNKNQKTLKLDSQLVKAYLSNLSKLQQELKLPGEITVDFLSGNYQLFTTQEEEAIPSNDVSPQLEQALGQALDSLEQMRVEEGRTIYEDINKIAGQIKNVHTQIEQYAPQLATHYKERLEQKIKKLSPQANITEERLAQEVAIFAERADISEELVRLDSHLNQLLGFLETEGAIGKKLDFLVQEMNRETNTIGSKVADVTISQQVVEIKCQLEKIREQVQNIE
jgi:uncharacterized protein (TIGR00255 family)